MVKRATPASRVGKALRDRREEARDSQQDVARAVGISQNLVSMLELGNIDKPSMEHLVKYGARYGLTPNDIAKSAGWWSPSKASSDVPEEVAEIVAELTSLPTAVRTQLSGVIRMMVHAAVLDARRHK